MGRYAENNNYQNAVSEEKLYGPPMPAYLSLPIIIIAFFLCFPLAIFLIWKRTNVKKIDINGSKALEVVGWIFLICGIIYIIEMISGVSYNLTFPTIFTIGVGTGLIVLGRRIRKAARRYKRYIDVIIKQGMISIDDIAAAVLVSYDTAEKDLQKMINSGFFAGAYINKAHKKIILAGNYVEVRNKEQVQDFSEVEVACKGCGANNKIRKNSVGVCEFCGSPISG